MNKLHVIVFAFALLLQPMLAGAEISLEGIEMIEQLRRKLSVVKTEQSQCKKTEQQVSSEKYIPGTLLKLALKRYRKIVYGNADFSDAETSIVKVGCTTARSRKRIDSLSSETKKVSVKEPYVAGSMLKEALQRIKASRHPVKYFDEDYKPDEQFSPGTVRNDHDELTPTITASAPDCRLTPGSADPKFNDSKIIDQEHKVAETSATDYSAGDELAAAIERIRESRKRILIRSLETSPIHNEKISPSINGAANNSGQNSMEENFLRSHIVPEVETKEKESDKLNQEIKKYEYRMPDNYRIIVR
ncbi:MAG: hypothetical protein Kow0029_10240 [Candidatus Rifleibacteriota bacterium]